MQCAEFQFILEAGNHSIFKTVDSSVHILRRDVVEGNVNLGVIEVGNIEGENWGHIRMYALVTLFGRTPTLWLSGKASGRIRTSQSIRDPA